MEDHILRATACGNQIRAFAIKGNEMVEKARVLHDTYPVATAALGRLLMGGAMMGIMMKGEKDVLTITMKGDGPLGAVVVTADSHGNVKGYVDEPHVDIPLNYAGKLDVGAAIGYGEMTVVKDLGLKEPYVSQLPLGTSEVAEDLTYYFYKSEQTPGSVALGVLVDKDTSVKQAGGFIVQLMPQAKEEVIDKLEKKLECIPSVTAMMEAGLDTEGILNAVLGDFDLEIIDTVPVRFYCHCSKERFAAALATLSAAELDKLIEEGESVTTKCHFCNSEYVFTPEDLSRIRQGNA